MLCLLVIYVVSTVYYNLKLRHPTLNMPIIDYDLALLIQPMLMLGITIGVVFNVVFSYWIVTILLIVLFLGNNYFNCTSTKSLFKGIETWKKETIIKEAGKHPVSNGEFGPNHIKVLPDQFLSDVAIIENVYWKEFGLLVFVWVSFPALQIGKENYTTTCPTFYWALNLLQYSTPLSHAGDLLFTGHIVTPPDKLVCSSIKNLGHARSEKTFAPLLPSLLRPSPFLLSFYATTTFSMTFSLCMSVIEYYLLKRFPVPYVQSYYVSMHRNFLLLFLKTYYMGFEDLCKYGS
ncbi:hypothetical protein JHK84_050774 [Glycine max]|nr:hypothetical protein JHK84_050774 [Glycine max]